MAKDALFQSILDEFAVIVSQMKVRPTAVVVSPEMHAYILESQRHLIGHPEHRHGHPTRWRNIKCIIDMHAKKHMEFEFNA